MRARIVLATLAAIAAATSREDRTRRFVHVGIGGGGAMFSPSCSPHDHRLMFVACDMGGVYRTRDGGTSWTMLDKRQLRNGKDFPVQFHPTDPHVLYAIGDSRLLRSRDRGESFQLAVPNPPWGNDRVRAVWVGAAAGTQLMVAAGKSVYTSNGKDWTRSEDIGQVLQFLALRSGPNEHATVFARSTSGVFRSDDLGASWRSASRGLPWLELRGLCGGRDASTGNAALYCTITSKRVEGALAGGIYRSLDLGVSWQSAMGPGLNRDIGRQDAYGFDELPQYTFIASAENRPETVYAATRGTGGKPPHHFTVYRSDDYGATWRSCMTSGLNIENGWIPVEFSWGWGGPAMGLSVCASDPDVAMFTNLGELYITRDGGKRWHAAYGRRVSGSPQVQRGESWGSSGLEVTGAWQFERDPHDRNRAYICYTDIGFARSEDGGSTWRYGGRGSPWRNTWYRIAFDPKRAGVIYAACANLHNIPHFMELDPSRRLQPARRGGGVCVSEDFGQSWRPLGTGLPEAPATSVTLDPKSDTPHRSLYVTMFGEGVFKSTDSGRTWHKASNGLGTDQNRHAYSIKLHADGTLLCSVTGHRTGAEFTDGSGLYRSSDGGANWQCISPPLKWAGDFDFDPSDSRIIYLTASTAPRFPQGGLYKTNDGGNSWQQLVKEGDLPGELHRFIHAFFVTVHPQKPDTVYLSAYTHGLFLSEDAGSTWREIQGIPFTGVQRITIDPVEDDTIWVTTLGGGVWKGPARGY